MLCDKGTPLNYRYHTAPKAVGNSALLRLQLVVQFSRSLFVIIDVIVSAAALGRSDEVQFDAIVVFRTTDRYGYEMIHRRARAVSGALTSCS